MQPARALLAPSWLAALLVLALNDHWLKYAGLLPPWLTGKLSDVVGLYVAPALLATLVHARTRPALIVCHVAIGLGFAAINLDAGFATGWAGAMGALGFPWRIVTDIGDLIALPALLASYRWLLPHMQRAAGGRFAATAQRGFAAAGLLCCMATSAPVDEPAAGSTFQGPHLHNASGQMLTVLVRPLRPGLVLDCEALAADPGRALPDAAFDLAVAYSLEAGDNLPVRGANLLVPGANVPMPGAPDSGCGAARISGGGLLPALLFWRTEQLPFQFVPARYEDPSAALPGAIVMAFEQDKPPRYRSVGGEFVFAIDTRPAEAGVECRAPNESARPTTSGDLPNGLVQLLDFAEGADGCVALRLLRSSDGRAPTTSAAAQVPASALPATVYVCMPQGMFPFEAGDRLDIQQFEGELRIAREDAGSPELELIVAAVSDAGYVERLDLSVRPREHCPLTAHEDCAETSLPATLEVRTGSRVLVLDSGAPAQLLSLPDAELEIAAPFIQWRALLDPSCAVGSPESGGDATVVIVRRGGSR